MLLAAAAIAATPLQPLVAAAVPLVLQVTAATVVLAAVDTVGTTTPGTFPSMLSLLFQFILDGIKQIIANKRIRHIKNKVI